MMDRKHRPLVAALVAMTVLGASTSPALARKKQEPSGFEPTLPVSRPVQPQAPTGGIFNASAGYSPLYTGTRAARVGDPVTIMLVENTTATKSVTSKNSKGGSASIVPPTAGPLSFLNPDALKASSSSSFNGGGNAAQTSTLASTLSVTIAEVRPNGTALVKGEKKMLLSQGDEWVRFSGIIRLADINQENAIPSSRVADARIEYTGKGALQRSSKQGWLGRFFNLISPF
ncbi:flagellar basal body L-ring protein FlgH [Novosphingobium mangrovi (ex Huang et al. 2023)]|uniref:Flagellar L-ring protein n=1 Tax=Novosphingobium mangrovi (ex Huang et al. 2023) TaxID=2976432 RepID=A0ABT2I0M8_9SPHN|nr:flagellar basal body L-ring protein FlgH [Novosphingobium mangrovi (ex Huang et al. 2023)]MCT2398157.1 flagellar basal body L-ring protein FlgH [Novosphingobium mangrovi (ex Huang et al. 2023)]